MDGGMCIMEDIVIIGAGIVGCFLAHDLSKYDLKITVIEKEADIANATTMANSAIIHTGYDPKEGTLKAKLNVRGARMYPSICKELQIDYQPCGAYIVARDEKECRVLQELRERAKQRGIEATILSQEEIRKTEANIADQVIQALSVPQTAIIYPWQCAIALMEEAVLNGTTVKLDQKVESIEESNGSFIIHTDTEQICSRIVINAAGCGAEEIADMIEEAPFHITCKKGEYFVLSKLAKTLVNHIIYPVPTQKGKGVLAVPTTHGNVLLGPNNDVCEPSDLAVTAKGMESVRQQIKQTLKNIPYHEVIRSYCGLRPSGNDGDFYIRSSQKNPHFIHVGCIDSPGLASAPAISEYVIDQLIRPLCPLKDKQAYQKRTAPIVMADLDEEEKAKLIQEQPLYGKIVCKCEAISYQEIVDAVHGPCGAKTIKAIKKRVRPGMGKCQGGFCEVEVAKILAKELNIPLASVRYDGKGSELGMEAKE